MKYLPGHELEGFWSTDWLRLKTLMQVWKPLWLLAKKKKRFLSNKNVFTLFFKILVLTSVLESSFVPCCLMWSPDESMLFLHSCLSCTLSCTVFVTESLGEAVFVRRFGKHSVIFSPRASPICAVFKAMFSSLILSSLQAFPKQEGERKKRRRSQAGN